MNNTLSILTEKINEVCPIHGLNSDFVISFKDEATQEQISSANSVIIEYQTNPEVWLSANTPLPSREEYLKSQGFKNLDLIDLSNLQFMLVTQQIPLPTKAAALNDWFNMVRVSFAMGVMPGSNAPYSFVEVQAEVLESMQNE